MKGIMENGKGYSWLEIILIVLVLLALVFILMKAGKGSIDEIRGLADLGWEKVGLK